jgi:hypothetical protein
MAALACGALTCAPVATITAITTPNTIRFSAKAGSLISCQAPYVDTILRDVLGRSLDESLMDIEKCAMTTRTVGLCRGLRFQGLRVV